MDLRYQKASNPQVAALIREGIPLAQKITHRKVSIHPGRFRELKGEMYTAALEGLVDAACRFEVGRGTQFASYAKHRINGSIRDWLRTLDHISKHHRAKARKTGDEDVRPPLPIDALREERRTWAHPGLNPFESLCYFRMLAVIEQAIAALPDKKRAALAFHYREGWKLKEIGDALGYSETRACQVMREIRESIRSALIEAGFDRR